MGLLGTLCVQWCGLLPAETGLTCSAEVPFTDQLLIGFIIGGALHVCHLNSLNVFMVNSTGICSEGYVFMGFIKGVHFILFNKLKCVHDEVYWNMI